MLIKIGSRGSKLALVQSEEVVTALKQNNSELDVSIEVISTKGDRILDKPLNKIGDKGLFTQEIENKLINEEIHLAVHSMKDMPSSLPEELMFVGSIEGNDPRDCLVFNGNYHTWKDLPFGAKVGTGSLRRKYQLLQLRPDLNVVDIRGNVQTRLKKMKDEKYDALVLAAAGLKRLGLENQIGYIFDIEEMIPACCQGILAIEVKKNSDIIPLLKEIEDQHTTERMKLERLYLSTIGGTCHEPIGIHVDENRIAHAIYGKDENTIKVIHRKIQTQEDIILLAKEIRGD